MRVVFCCPTYIRPKDEWLASMEAMVPAIEKAFPGIEHALTFEIGSAYISWARATMLRRALDAKADYVVFLDDDLSFPPESMVKLLATPGDVVAGTYRLKQDEERYMGYFYQIDSVPCARADGALEADRIPAGFLKVSKEAVDLFIEKYPELCFGARYAPHIDLFAHGVHEHVWWGEDYSFSRRYLEAGGEIWLIPDIDIDHHHKGQVYRGNLHKFIVKERLPCASLLQVPPGSSGTTLSNISYDTLIGKSQSSIDSTTQGTLTDSQKSDYQVPALDFSFTT